MRWHLTWSSKAGQQVHQPRLGLALFVEMGKDATVMLYAVVTLQQVKLKGYTLSINKMRSVRFYFSRDKIYAYHKSAFNNQYRIPCQFSPYMCMSQIVVLFLNQHITPQSHVSSNRTLCKDWMNS